MTAAATARAVLLRRGIALEGATLAWNVVGTVVVLVAAVRAGSAALAGFGLDSLVEIGASTVVVWQLRDTGGQRERRALTAIGAAFVVLAVYIAAESAVTLLGHHHPRHSALGMVWTGATCAVMLGLAAAKARTGRALENPVLRAEARVTLVDAYLAGAVLLGLVLNAALGWWWADPVAALVIVGYAVREARELLGRSSAR